MGLRLPVIQSGGCAKDARAKNPLIGKPGLGSRSSFDCQSYGSDNLWMTVVSGESYRPDNLWMTVVSGESYRPDNLWMTVSMSKCFCLFAFEP
ncbi:MAG TPA: hypothetical protein VGD40_17310 [Chryseosolibacter sp.]